MSATQATTLFGLSAVKSWLKVSDSSQDALITQIADAVSQRVEAVTKRAFVTRSFTETRDGDGKLLLLLRHYPISVWTSFTVKDTPDGTPNPFVNGTDFDLDVRLGRLLMRVQAITRGFQNVVATYTAGFDAQDGAALPQDVYEAGLDYVKVVYSEFDANAIAANSVALGPSTFVLKPQLPYGIKSVLDQWRGGHL